MAQTRVPKAALARWDKMYKDMQERITRQKEAIDRLLAANTEATAALFEIVALDESVPGHANAIRIARGAVERLDALASGSGNSPDEAG